MATNGVRCSYQEVVDLHTESDRVTVIGIHTPTGSFPRQMFKGFFDMYKKYKYLGCSISLVPAARLPADPSMVSYEGGEAVLDARDLMNPIMFHGCHGDDLGGVLNRLYGDNGAISDTLDGIDIGSTGVLMDPEYTVMERLYYKALTDKTWKKAHPMRGFRKSGLRPLLYSLAVNRQIMPASIPTGLSDRNMFGFDDENDLAIAFGDPTTDYDTESKTVTFQTRNNLQFSTPRLTGLGWIDTRQVLTSSVPFDIETGMTPDEVASDVGNAFAINYAELPKLFMGVILLPPAYKTEQYFRMIINHHFAFKNFRGVSFQPGVDSVPTYWNKNGDGTGPYDVVGDLSEGHMGSLNNSGGDIPFDPPSPPEPDPDPPEPDPPEPDPPTPSEPTTLYYTDYEEYHFSGQSNPVLKVWGIIYEEQALAGAIYSGTQFGTTANVVFDYIADYNGYIYLAREFTVDNDTFIHLVEPGNTSSGLTPFNFIVNKTTGVCSLNSSSWVYTYVSCSPEDYVDVVVSEDYVLEEKVSRSTRELIEELAP